ncbi:MAG: hypothetical protein OK422_06085 [Thaumarchaeota archaeon]|nr:hypothetical protein [Nitrososphaerota archaeon]
MLVQSGWVYGTALNGSHPDMFVELYGSFSWNGHTCTSYFCGYRVQESAGNSLWGYDDASNNNWVAYVEDDSVTGIPYIAVIDSFTATGISNTLPYAIVSMEAAGAPSASYITTPISFTSVTVWNPNAVPAQVNIDTNDMLAYDGPTGSSGVTATYSATGLSTGTVKVS